MNVPRPWAPAVVRTLPLSSYWPFNSPGAQALASSLASFALAMLLLALPLSLAVMLSSAPVSQVFHKLTWMSSFVLYFTSPAPEVLPAAPSTPALV